MQPLEGLEWEARARQAEGPDVREGGRERKSASAEQGAQLFAFNGSNVEHSGKKDCFFFFFFFFLSNSPQGRAARVFYLRAAGLCLTLQVLRALEPGKGGTRGAQASLTALWSGNLWPGTALPGACAKSRPAGSRPSPPHPAPPPSLVTELGVLGRGSTVWQELY